MKKDYNRIEAIVDIGDNEFELVNCNMEPVHSIENGVMFWFEYDEFGRRICMYDDNEYKICYTYDEYGNLSEKFIYLNNILKDHKLFNNEYDEHGRLIHTYCDDGFDRQYTYNKFGECIYEIWNYPKFNNSGYCRITWYDYDHDANILCITRLFNYELKSREFFDLFKYQYGLLEPVVIRESE